MSSTEIKEKTSQQFLKYLRCSIKKIYQDTRSSLRVCKCVGVLQVEKCIRFAFFASLLFCTQRVPMSIFIFDVNICIEERH